MEQEKSNIRICSPCLISWSLGNNVDGELKEEMHDPIKRCANRCYMYLTASNCEIDKDRYVIMDESSRRY